MLLTPHGLSIQLQGSQASLQKFGCRKGKQKMVWGTLCPECFKPLLSIPLVWETTNMVTTSNELNVCIPPKFLFWSSVLSLSLIFAQLCLTLYNSMDYAHWASLSMKFSRQEYWNRLPFPSPGDLSKPGIEPKDQTQVSCIAGRCFTVWATRDAPLKS